LAILGGRSLVAGLTLLLWQRRIERHFSRWQIVGALAYVFTQLLFITATKLTTAANAIFLQYTAPVYVMLLGRWLLREQPRRSDWVAMAVILGGLALFFGDDLQTTGMLGNVLAIISGVLLAVVTVSMRAVPAGGQAQTFMLGTAVGALLGAPWLLAAPLDLPNLGIIAFLGVFQMGLALICYSAAARHVPALEASLILTLEPILNPLWVLLVVGETPGRWALVGAALVLAAVIGRAAVRA
jgi:drug/metabolite transporter (DMT)-like permease